MRLISIKPLRERGDTIVEVLIAIGVLSLILGGAYVMTSRSIQGARTAQERVEALKLVESQLEQIKNYAATDPDAIFGVAGDFCINGSGAVVGAGGADCTFGADGNSAPSAEPIYTLTVRRNSETFTVRNTWQNVGGGHQNAVQITYRVQL